MSLTDEYEDVLRQIAKRKTARDKAKGALETSTKRLLKEHGCKNLVEAKAKLAKLEKAEKESAEKLRQAMDSFKDDHNAGKVED